MSVFIFFTTHSSDPLICQIFSQVTFLQDEKVDLKIILSDATLFEISLYVNDFLMFIEVMRLSQQKSLYQY